MKFGNWSDLIHNDSEQIKRYENSKKANVTPSSVNVEEQSAIFKGSGKNPYLTTLNSCTCIDFSRRKLPCKHIYRLANELNLTDATSVANGVNKNELKSILDSLSIGAKNTLFNMAYNCIHDENIINLILHNSDITNELLASTLVVESSKSYSSVASNFSGKFLLEELSYTPEIVIPYKHKTKIIKCIAEIEKNNIEILSNNLVLLELTPQSIELKHTIHRHLYKFLYPDSYEGKLSRLNELYDKRIISKSSYEERLEYLNNEYSDDFF